MNRVNEQLEDRVELRSAELQDANKRLEKDLAGRDWLTRIYREAPVGLCCFDTQLRYLDINEWLAALNGLSVEEHLGRSVSELFPELAEGIESQLRHVLETGEPILEGSVFAETPAKPNEKRYFQHNYVAVKSDDGTIVGVSCAVVEITEWKKAERALKLAHDELEHRVEKRTAELEDINRKLSEEIEVRKRTEQELNLSSEIIENMAEGVCLLRASDGCLVFTNPRFDEIFGYETRELIGQHPAILNAPGENTPEEIAVEILNDLEKTGNWSGEVNNIRKEGTTIWTHSCVSTFEHTLHGTVRVAVVEDITERKHAEKALQVRIQRYELVAEGADDAIWDWDLIDQSVYFSPRWKEMLGFDSNEVSDSEEEWSSRIHPDDSPRVMAALQAHLEGKTELFHEEYRLRCKDGTHKWVLTRGLAQRDAVGNVVRMAGSDSDITERKQAEAELRESEERIRALLEGAFEGIVISDKGKILEANHAFADMYGYALDEVIGLSPVDITIPESAQKIEEHIAGGDEKLYEIVGRKKNGTTFDLEVLGKNCMYRGRIARIAAMRDITERKRLDEAVRTLVQVSSHQYGESFFEFMALELAKVLQADYTLIGKLQENKRDSIRTIAAVDDGKLMAHSLYDLVGTPCEYVVDKGVCSYASKVADQFPRDTLLKEMAVEGYVGVPLLSASGAPLGIMTAMYRSPLANTDFAESILQIFSSRVSSEIERKRSEEKARSHLDALAHVNRVSTMGEMASGLAHELNQPLAAIGLYAETCLINSNSTPGDNAELTPILEKIRDQSVRAGEIIRRLRKFVNKGTPRTETVRVPEVIDDVLMLLESELRDEGVTVDVQLPDDLPAVRGDTIQLEQVVLNLICNACEAMREDGSDRREIVLRASISEGGTVEITVRDTGPGMSEEAATQVFDAFFTTKSEGMGMGLAICRTILESHGGNISVSRNSDCGVTFRIALPKAGEENRDDI